MILFFAAFIVGIVIGRIAAPAQGQHDPRRPPRTARELADDLRWRAGVPRV